ncbi:MAG: THUMP domain-containing protein [Gemmatimonadota bacterium]
MGTPEHLDAFAVAAPGLAPVLAAELAGLGVAAGRVAPEGVEFRTDLAGLCRVNLCSRTASRVLVRIARFRAAHFDELVKGATVVDWQRWIEPGSAVRFRVTCSKSRLYHQRAVEERLRGVLGAEGAVPDDDGLAALVVVRIHRDQCTLSIDSSGELLHRRGYRLATAKAPLRETLAAALLLACGWDGGRPLVDPFCGSGTVAIEGALLARQMAPGAGRGFALERWPWADGAVLEQVRRQVAAAVLPRAPAPIRGPDRDEGAVAAARANAERAGVLGDVVLERSPVSDLRAPPGVGLVLTNPPYGLRVRGGKDLRDLYDRFGQVLRGDFRGWQVAVLGTDRSLVGRLQLDLEAQLRTTNGGVPVTLFVGTVP